MTGGAIAQDQALQLLRARLGWSEIASASVVRLDELLSSLSDTEFPGGIVPVLDGGKMAYYAVAKDEDTWRRLQPLLRAAIAVTISDWTGLTPEPDSSDDIERDLRAMDYSRVIRITSGGNVERGRQLAYGLARLREAWSERPTTSGDRFSSTKAMLSAFYHALDYRERARCEVILEELTSGMRLDGLNLLFLRVKMHARFSEWEQLADREFLSSLSEARRPQRVTNAIAEAIYRHEFESFERELDPRGAIEYFRRELFNSTGNLLQKIPVNPSTQVVKLITLSEISAERPDRRVIGDIERLATEWPDVDRKFLDLLLEQLPAVEEPEDDPKDAEPAEVSLLSRAANHTLESGREAAIGLIVEAYVDGSLEAYGTCTEFVTTLADDVREELLSERKIAVLYQEITRGASGDLVPANWVELIGALPEIQFLEARELAESAANEWSLTEHLDTSAAVSELVAALDAPDEATMANLFLVLPELVNWLKTDDQWPNPGYTEIYRNLLILLLYPGSGAKYELTAVADILAAILKLGIERSDYLDVMDLLRQDMVPYLGADDLDAMIDIAEITLALPSADEDARKSFWSRSVARFNDLAQWTRSDQVVLFSSLAEIIGVSEAITAPIPEKTPSDLGVESDYTGMVVGIYTLTESVGGRAKDRLEQHLPGVVVRVNSDLHNTRQLTSLAEGADLFVICWDSAKHAATNAVQDVRRPQGKATCYATGTSSIVREVTNYFTTARSEAA